jgi:hypothetical protein
MGLKFAGRTESRGGRFLHGTARRHRSTLPGAAPSLATFISGAAVVLLLACVLSAVFREALGANPRLAFWPALMTLPVVLCRVAGQSSAAFSYAVAGGVLLVAGLWHLIAMFTGRRTHDAILAALLAFQTFFVFRYLNTLLPPAGPLSVGALSLPQKINLGLESLLLLLALVAVGARPRPNTTGYASAPSRVTGFLRRRRLPWRIAGVLLMALTVFFTWFTSAPGEYQGSAFVLLRMPALFAVWIALDGLYLIGRALWQRVH